MASRPAWILCLFWLAALFLHVAFASGHQEHSKLLRRAPALLSSASSAEIVAARKLVKEASAKSAELNKARLANPARNIFGLAPGTVVGDRAIDKRSTQGDPAAVPPLLEITPELAQAAALVAEADAAAGNWTVPAANLTKRASSFWMETLPRMGASPWGTDASYKVFRNVKDYGALGDGKNDDTKAIWRAINDGGRCAAGCNGQTTKNAIVYFPAGTYMVTTNITVTFGTQLVGDANNWPTIKAAGSFLGLGVLSTDEYVGNGAGSDSKDNEWYVNTASFYRQIRNFRIDVTATPPENYVCGIHYQVAQAASLQNIEIIARSGTTQQGMFSENGSGGFMSDITFTGGAFGFYGGNQQFTVRNMKFNGCDTAVQIIWDWAWIWKSVTITNSKVGFMLNPDGGTGVIGSITVMDSIFKNVAKAIVMGTPSSITDSKTTGIVLDNVLFQDVTQPVSDYAGKTYLQGSKTLSIPRWILGPMYNGTDRTWVGGAEKPMLKDVSLTTGNHGDLPSAPYFERSKPQYENTAVSNFVHLKQLGAKGDGVTDDTAALRSVFKTYANSGKIIFADAGVYMITDTVYIPAGTKIVGEAWTQFAATGPKFGDQRNPRAMLQVGKVDEQGDVEMQDLIFTSKGPTPGLVLVEWNILAKSQGSAAVWDCHVRLGGATGTGLTPAECPAYTDGTVKSECLTANLMMHLTSNSSGYFENMWLWTADHMIDDPDLKDDKNAMTQVSVFTARGMLVESTTATWLYATASEHAVMYQFNFYEAFAVFAGLLQTESPYYQPKPKAPAPFTSNVGQYSADPEYDCNSNFSGCDSSWAVIINGCESFHIAALGAYSWFDDYTQECINPHTCQSALILAKDNGPEVRLEQVITIGANTSIVIDGNGIGALTNLAVSNNNASWSQISSIDLVSHSTGNFLNIPESSCDWTLNYTQLVDVQNDLANLGSYCAGVQAVGVMLNMLGEALDNYTDSANGYDDKFDAYAKYIRSLIPGQLDSCLALAQSEPHQDAGPCNKYFTCQTTNGGPSGPCPPNGYNFDQLTSWDIWYTLKDENGFYNELNATYGIEKDWIQFGPVTQSPYCLSEPDSPCPPISHTQWNFPKPADNIAIPNPKDVFVAASTNLTDLYWGMSNTFNQMITGGWNGTIADAMTVFVLPVTLAYTAAQSMEQVKVIGGNVEDADRKALILEIVGAVLMALPFAGELLGGAGTLLATIGRIASIAGNLGGAGLGIYEIIQHPDNAAMEVVGILMGFAGANLGRGFGKGSSEVRGMADTIGKAPDSIMSKLGDQYAANAGIMKKISPGCAR